MFNLSFLPRIPSTQRHRPPNYQLPEAEKKSWELLRKSGPEFKSTVGSNRHNLCRARLWLARVTTPQSLKSTLVDPRAPDGNRRERWLDNIWLWWNNRKRKYLNNSSVTPRNLKLDNTKIHLRNRTQQQPLGSVCGKFRSRSCSWRWMITGSQRDNRGGIGSSVLVWELHFWDWEIHL